MLLKLIDLNVPLKQTSLFDYPLFSIPILYWPRLFAALTLRIFILWLVNQELKLQEVKKSYFTRKITFFNCLSIWLLKTFFIPLFQMVSQSHPWQKDQNDQVPIQFIFLTLLSLKALQNSNYLLILKLKFNNNLTFLIYRPDDGACVNIVCLYKFQK